MQAELLKLIENFDVISFDVFNTLLLRPYLKPTDLFERIEIESRLPGFSVSRQNADQGAGAVVRALSRAEIPNS